VFFATVLRVRHPSNRPPTLMPTGSVGIAKGNRTPIMRVRGVLCFCLCFSVGICLFLRGLLRCVRKMATIYRRKDSKFWWLRIKRGGVWKCEKTDWLIGDRAGEKKARVLAAERTLQEIAKGRHLAGNFDDWVDAWLLERYGARGTSTYSNYALRWSWLSRWMKEFGLTHPSQITRAHLSQYRQWRAPENQKGHNPGGKSGTRNKGGRLNTVIQEIRFFGLVLAEAKAHGYCSEIVTAKLGWQAEERREYEPWTDEEVAKALSASENLPKKRAWIRAALILGTYQASRCGQTAAPLSAFDFNAMMIYWPKSVMKGKKRDWVQPLDPRAAALLKPIVEARRAEGKKTLADLPQIRAVQMREFLDSLGIPKVHHGLRSTWITKAALANIPQAASMAFVHHAGEAVHRIYQRVKPAQSAVFLEKISFGETSLPKD